MPLTGECPVYMSATMHALVCSECCKMTALAKRTVLSPHDGHNDHWVACVVLPCSVVTSDELCLPTLNRETCIATESRATCHGFHGLCSIAC
jgi:hypothetical protein